MLAPRPGRIPQLRVSSCKEPGFLAYHPKLVPFRDRNPWRTYGQR